MIDPRARAVALLLLSLTLAGCPKPKQPPEPCKELPLELHLAADAQLNLNAAGQPAPVEVQVMLLAERELFDELDFHTVWREGDKALGKGLLKKQSLTVYPKQEKISVIKGPLETAYVAIVPLFRQPDDVEWRQVIDIRAQAKLCRPGGLHIPVRVRLSDNRVTKLAPAPGP